MKRIRNRDEEKKDYNEPDFLLHNITICPQWYKLQNYNMVQQPIFNFLNQPLHFAKYMNQFFNLTILHISPLSFWKFQNSI